MRASPSSALQSRLSPFFRLCLREGEGKCRSLEIKGATVRTVHPINRQEIILNLTRDVVITERIRYLYHTRSSRVLISNYVVDASALHPVVKPSNDADAFRVVRVYYEKPYGIRRN